jgi:hypothetical protein
MNRCAACFCLLLLLSGCSGNTQSESQAPDNICTQQWFKTIQAAVSTGDGHGHGPDIGSDEWQSAVELKLGIRDNMDTPERNTMAWCVHIDKLVDSAMGPKPEITK